MEFCVKIGGELANDLYQELFVILCEKDSEWIESKYASGYWEGIVIRICLNQFYGKRTTFDKHFKQPIGLYDTEDVQIPYIEEKLYNEYFYLSIEQVVKKCDWYETRIWQLYSKGDKDKGIKPRSARSISRVTEISRQEILRVINTIKQKANDHFITNYRHIVLGDSMG